MQVPSQEDNLLGNSIDKEPETTSLPEAEPNSVAVNAATTLSNIGGSLATNLGQFGVVFFCPDGLFTAFCRIGRHCGAGR